MRKTLVVSLAFALAGMGGAYGQSITKLANGEVWAKVQVHPTIAVRLLPEMPATGQFQTAIVRNLPESNIVNAPQSLMIEILGDCRANTVQILGVLPYAGKMRGGLPETELATGPEGVTRQVKPDSLMGRVFSIVCRKP